MEKYGFIYLWFDRKHKRFYLGRHWGSIDDGYICSSRNMRDNYRYRPTDFKRKVISRVNDKEQLVKEEQRWFDMIKKEELGVRYYNRTLRSDAPSMNGRKHSESTKEKMRLAALGKPKSEAHREKLRQSNLGKKYSPEVNAKKAGNRDYSDPVFRAKMSAAAKNRSPETRQKISDNNKRLHKEGRIGNYKHK
jgi:hypothetical protein